MKKTSLLISSVAIVYYLVLLCGYAAGLFSGHQITAMLISGFLAFLNAFSSVWGFNRGENSKNSKFLLYNLGLMALRMLLVLIIIFILFQYFSIDKYAFVFSFFFCYIIFLVIEINHFAKKSIGKKI